MASASWVEMYALLRISMMPSSTPPTMAPGTEPMPPNTAATKALMPGMAPVVGCKMGYDEHSSAPATAARALPMAKVSEMVALTLMPISCAAPLSSETASIARPRRVRLMNSVSAAMITTETPMVTRASPVITSRPPANCSGSMLTIDEKDMGVEPQMSSAMFCKK